MEQHADVVLDLAGNAVEGATVQVLAGSGNAQAGYQTPAQIFDVNGAARTNPVVTGKLGEFAFSVANGKYVLRVMVRGTVYRTLGPLTFYDPADDTERGGGVSDPSLRADIDAARDDIKVVEGVAAQAWDKLDDFVSVKDTRFAGGAKGDGVADDTAAIQAAIDSLGTKGGQVLFPPGVYLADGIRITAATNVHLRGTKYSGAWYPQTLGSTIKARSPANDVFTFSAYSNNCTVEGLQITNGNRAIHFDRCLGCHVYNVNLRDNKIGIEWFGNGVGVVRDCMIRDNTEIGIYLAQSSGDTDICNCDIGNNKINLLVSTGGVRVFGGSIFSSKYDGQGVGVKIDRTSESSDTVIRNVKFYGVLIANNAHQIIIKGTSLAERDVQDVLFHGCHIHGADDGGENFDPTFPWGYGAYIENAAKGIRFVDCDFVGLRNFALQAVNCLDGVRIQGGSVRRGHNAGVVFDLVQWGRIEGVEFTENVGTAVVMMCSDTGNTTQNNRVSDCNFRGNGLVYTEDVRARANFLSDHLGPLLGDYLLNTALPPMTQIRHVSQGGNQLSLKNQSLFLDGAAWDGSRLILGSHQFWVDAAGRLRSKNSNPTGDTDGAVVGAQQ